MRKSEEQMGGLDASNKLEYIIKFTNLLIRNKKFYIKMTKIKNPYGDGKASERIVKQLKKSI